MAEEVKLLGLWFSPFVLRAKIALNLKGVEYENEEQELGNKSELLLKSNPVYKKVPVLIHNGKPVCESTIIVQYVDEAWATAGPSIVPSDPYDRAIARFWAVYIDDKWFPSLIAIVKGAMGEAKEAAIEQVYSGLQLLEEAFGKCSKGSGFFGGESIGYLDIALGGYLAFVKVLEDVDGLKFLNEAKTPLLVGWAARFRSDNAVKDAMPEPEKLAELAKMFRANQSANTTN